MQIENKHRVFSGDLLRCKHWSKSLACDMHFSIFLPPQIQSTSLPCLYWLSGLTCTDENFPQKAGAFRRAAQLGLVIVVPDTSPRGANILGEDDAYDLGTGAGFYVNATQAPWRKHYQMLTYVVEELPELLETHFALTEVRGISGHSMGGHGALICALKNPERYQSVSAFAPIGNPMKVPWGRKAFSHYLGDNEDDWKEYDSCELVKVAEKHLPILIDQGLDDEFIETELFPNRLHGAFLDADYPVEFRMQVGYDHSYYFISSFIDDHLEHHYAAFEQVSN